MFSFSIFYLSLPVFLFLFSFFSYPFVILSTVALVVLVFCLYTDRYLDRHGHFRLNLLTSYWPFVLIAVAVSCLCLAFPFQIWDWEKHYAVFDLLVSRAWPPVLEIDDKTWVLRYYVAWYALPALISKLFGAQLLSLAMIVWTAVGIFVSLFLAFHKLQKPSHLFLVAVVFLLFSGLDIVGVFYFDDVEGVTPNWLQWWGMGGYIGSYLFGLSLLPQHTVGMCLSACLFLYHRQLAVRYGALIIVITTMWSLFSAVGLLPIVVWALRREGYHTALTRQNLLVAPLLAIPIALYLIQGGQYVPFMFVWQWGKFIFEHSVVFLLTEIIIIAIILFYIREKSRDLIVTTVAFLLFLYLFRVGEFGELLSRSAIPIVCVWSVVAAFALLENRGLRREILALYLLIGALPVLVAFGNHLSLPTVRAYQRTTFEELAHLYTWEKHPYVTYPCLTEKKDVMYVLGVPLMRGIPPDRQVHADIRL